MNSPRPIKIVAFGDSITEVGHQQPNDRWPVLLARLLKDRFPDNPVEVINAGVGGNTSREGLLRIDEAVLKHRPQFVTVEFGNDGTWEPERHVELDEFEANFDLIRKKIAESCGGQMIVLTFTPVIDEWHQFRDKEYFKPFGGLDALGERYREVTRKFASGRGLPLADIDQALRVEMAAKGPASCILPEDGVHLTARGNQILAETIFNVLRPEIEKLLSGGPRSVVAAAR